jgi:hypothetical protein
VWCVVCVLACVLEMARLAALAVFLAHVLACLWAWVARHSGDGGSSTSWCVCGRTNDDAQGRWCL